jgi:hypothetical protein
MDIDRALNGLVNSNMDGTFGDSALGGRIAMPVTPVNSGGDNVLSLLDEAQLLMSIAAPGVVEARPDIV